MNDTTLRTELAAARAEVNEIRRTTKPNDRTAAQWEAIALESRTDAAESFDRCDTDGFLSQWASNRMNARYLDMARIADNGGTIETHAVFDLDGNLVTIDRREGDYGPYWFIPQNEGKARFFNESKADKFATCRRNNEKKGYRIGSVRVKVDMAEHDYTVTDEVVDIVSTDLFNDYINAGRTSYFD